MRSVIRLAACTVALALVSTPALAQPGGGALTRHQRHVLYGIAALHYPVWGLSPSSTPDDTGAYNAYGAGGLAFPAGDRLAQCPTCATETAVTPHASAIALPVMPQQAFSNLETLRTQFPGIYSSDGGFYDAVDPVSGQVGHRRLVLDQSMIMAGLDNALRRGALQRYFARDPAAWAARLYLSTETMSIG